MKMKNNRGIALVSVLIVITLLSLLAGSVLNLAYMAYSRKLVEKRNNENFYAAEEVLDTVRAVLQNSVAVAIPEADSSDEDFVKAAFEAITGNKIDSIKVGDEFVAGTETEIKNVRDYLFDKITIATNTDGSSYYKKDSNVYAGDTSTVIAAALTATDETYDGVHYGNGGYFKVGAIVCEEDGVRIKDVEIYYVNDEGYTASITTDIVISAPQYITVSDALGTYSMFAGSGATAVTSSGDDNKKAVQQILYLHQEGNVYFGTKDDGVTAFELGTGGGDGFTIFSVGGESFICNGDVVLENGSALIFTGGDGTSTTQIQVNGYIVLKDGSSLFLAPNCEITCKGIVTSIEYDSAGNVVSYTPYTGSEGAETTASQFYPLTESYVSGLSPIGLSDYYSGTIDVEKLFSDNGLISSVLNDNSGLDAQYASTSYSGVYVLNSEQKTDSDGNITGWENRTGCYYRLLKCGTEAIGNVWNWTVGEGTSEATNSQIYCDVNDSKLDIVPKISYNGVDYDVEYFNMLNIPLLQIAPTQDSGYVTQVFQSYSSEKNASYTSTSWEEIYKDIMEGTSGEEGDVDYSKYSSLLGSSSIIWSDLYKGSDEADEEYWAEYGLTTFLSREFYIPTYSSTADFTTPDYSNYKIITDLGEFSVTSNSNVTFSGNSNVQPSGNAIVFYITAKEVDVQVRVSDSGYTTGIVMTNGDVLYGQNTGAMRMISLVDLASHVTSGSTDLADENNAVHKLLVYIGSLWIGRGLYTELGDYLVYPEILLADNMFNGGISAFWDLKGKVSSGSEDNSEDDFVDYDDWIKD